MANMVKKVFLMVLLVSVFFSFDAQADKNGEWRKKQREVRKNIHNLVKKQEVKGFTNLKEVCSNPFEFENKTIVIDVFLKTMISRTSGVFHDTDNNLVFIDHLKLDAGMAGGYNSKEYVVAVKVKGNTTLPNGTLPHLTFIEAAYLNGM